MGQINTNIFPYETFLVKSVLDKAQEDRAYKSAHPQELFEKTIYYLGLASVVKASRAFPHFYKKKESDHNEELDQAMKPYKNIRNWESLLPMMQKLLMSGENDQTGTSFLRKLTQFNYELEDERIERNIYDIPVLLISLYVVSKRDPTRTSERDRIFKTGNNEQLAQLFQETAITPDFMSGFEKFLFDAGYVDEMGLHNEFAGSLYLRNKK